MLRRRAVAARAVQHAAAWRGVDQGGGPVDPLRRAAGAVLVLWYFARHEHRAAALSSFVDHGRRVSVAGKASTTDNSSVQSKRLLCHRLKINRQIYFCQIPQCHSSFPRLSHNYFASLNTMQHICKGPVPLLVGRAVSGLAIGVYTIALVIS